MPESVQDLLTRVHAFESEAHQILARHEAAISRIITLEDTYHTLSGLSLHQDELFREALKCVEHQLFGAAHVIAWAAFMDYLENKMMSEYLADIKVARPRWSIKSLEDLREHVSEHQLIDVSQDIRLFSKNEKKAFLGLLNTRNECAHPSSYSPNLNETLGFISQLLNRIGMLQQKSHP